MSDALRLLFEWSEGRIHLRSAHRVAKRAPAGTPAQDAAADAATGMVLELRSGERVLYRRHIGPMFPDSHEVQTGDPERPFARAPRTKPYTVEILVPADRAERVMLVERRAEKPGAPPRAVVHVDEALKRDPGDTPQVTPPGTPQGTPPRRTRTQGRP